VNFVILTLRHKLEILLTAILLTATGIAISIQVLTELGKIHSMEERFILREVIVDNILAVVILSVEIAMILSHDVSSNTVNLAFLLLKILGLFTVLLLIAVYNSMNISSRR
jgi:Kef-type K+ transport system membrane component KefB